MGPLLLIRLNSFFENLADLQIWRYNEYRHITMRLNSFCVILAD
jgi:hypothetical protein